MQMDIDAIEEGTSEVRLAGRLDIEGAAKIETPLAALAGARRNLLVDLSGVTFMASIGIRALMMNAKAVGKRGGLFILYAPRPEVAQVLTATGIDQVIPVVGTRDEAQARLAATGS